MLSLRLAKGADRLPISADQLASAQAMVRPVSLRELLGRTGSRARRETVCVLRYTWGTTKPGQTHTVWADHVFDQILNAPNGWSLADYWRRSTFGLVELEFTIEPWRTLDRDQNSPDAAKRDVPIQWCKDDAATHNVPVGDFDHVVAFLHPANNNAGAQGGDALLDQAPGSLEFYQHECGHMLGFSHAFGTNADYVYEDDWCVMGITGAQHHTVTRPTELTLLPDEKTGFWDEGRRLSTAALYRYDQATDFSTTSSVVRVNPFDQPVTVDLVSSSVAGLFEPVVAVVEADRFRVTVEYRTATSDDAGIARPPAAASGWVVVHSIGRRAVLSWQGERDPVWLEQAVPAGPGQKHAVAGAWVQDDQPNLLVKVVSADHLRARVVFSRTDEG